MQQAVSSTSPSSKFAAMRQVHTYANNLSGWQRDRCLPVTAVPAAPVAVTPAPMTVTPTPVAMTPTPVTVVPVMAPTHLFRLEAAHFVFGRHGGNGIFVHRRQPFIFRNRGRYERCSLRTRSERRSTRGKSNSESQKMAALHDICSFIFASDARRV
jgi:hypothetical protein